MRPPKSAYKAVVSLALKTYIMPICSNNSFTQVHIRTDYNLGKNYSCLSIKMFTSWNCILRLAYSDHKQHAFLGLTWAYF